MAVDLLDKLDKESNQEQNKDLKVDKSPALEAIIQCFEKHVDKYYVEIKDYFSRRVYNLFKKTNYTPSDVLAFCIELKNLEIKYNQDDNTINHSAGEFLNHLIKYIPEKEININLSHFDTKLEWICSGDLRGKKISIIGDVDNLGFSMANGFVYLNGDVYDCGNDMVSGEIRVNGNINKLANCMNGGKIVVNGNVNYMNRICSGEVEIFGDVKNGISLDKGTIKLHGNYQLYYTHYETFSKNLNFYHKNKLLIKEGKIVKGAKIKWL